jgi:hypothetical protein
VRFRLYATAMAVLGLVGATSLGAGVDAAAAQQRIRPDQHFTGLVNGSDSKPMVGVVCPGPIYPGRTGPVAGGQTMSVGRAATGDGYTGPFSAIYSWFVPPANSTAPPTQLKFSRYRTPQDIPTSIRVPCGGTGKVEFSSCPYLAPCAYGWVPDYIKVRFVDIAA